MAPLTQRQAAIPRFVRRFMAVHQCSPTTREIAERFGIHSSRRVAIYLDALQRAGCLRWTPGWARSIKLPTDHTGPQRLLWDVFHRQEEPALQLAGSH